MCMRAMRCDGAVRRASFDAEQSRARQRHSISSSTFSYEEQSSFVFAHTNSCFLSNVPFRCSSALHSTPRQQSFGAHQRHSQAESTETKERCGSAQCWSYKTDEIAGRYKVKVQEVYAKDTSKKGAERTERQVKWEETGRNKWAKHLLQLVLHWHRKRVSEQRRRTAAWNRRKAKWHICQSHFIVSFRFNQIIQTNHRRVGWNLSAHRRTRRFCASHERQ